MLKILLIETIEAEVQLFDTQCPTLIGKRRKRNVVIKAETDLYLADEKEVLESGRIDVKVAIADGSGRVNPALTRRVFKLIESEEKRQDLSEDVFIQAVRLLILF
ncbi:hypothetical protein EB796_024387 [Bugula neritina]|nr:hypothetical protein EB796_024387 [Bugula neritina]